MSENLRRCSCYTIEFIEEYGNQIRKVRHVLDGTVQKLVICPHCVEVRRVAREAAEAIRKAVNQNKRREPIGDTNMRGLMKALKRAEAR